MALRGVNVIFKSNLGLWSKVSMMCRGISVESQPEVNFSRPHHRGMQKLEGHPITCKI